MKSKLLVATARDRFWARPRADRQGDTLVERSSWAWCCGVSESAGYMSGVRSMLQRVARLERSRDSPLIAYLGSPEFEVEALALVEGGKLDRMDWLGANGNSGILMCLKRWATDRVRLSGP